MNICVIPVFNLNLLHRTHKTFGLITFIFRQLWHTFYQGIGWPTPVWGCRPPSLSQKSWIRHCKRHACHGSLKDKVSCNFNILNNNDLVTRNGTDNIHVSLEIALKAFVCNCQSILYKVHGLLRHCRYP